MNRLGTSPTNGRMPDAPAAIGGAELDVETEAIARSRIERARIDILLEHPYFAAALLVLPMHGTADESIENAVATDGRRIVYRHDLVARLERPKVRHLLLHALAHVLLKHPERGVGREWPVWTAACDFAVEALFASLGMLSPGVEIVGSWLSKHGGTSSAEEIYESILRDELGQTLSIIRNRVRSRKQRRAKESDDPDRSRQDADGVGAARGTTEQEPREDPDHREDGLVPPPDREPASEEVRQQQETFRSLARVQDGAPPHQLDSMQHRFQESVRHHLAQRHGDKPGASSAEIEALRAPEIPWQAHLAAFMHERLDREWSLARPNRRHLWRGVYLPGPVEVEGGHFVVAIDTSASMSDRTLAAVLAEVDALRRQCACEVTVLQFDAAIQASGRFARWQDEDDSLGSTRVMRFLGRGGTDLRLPFQWAETERAKGERISALIVCTDGFGPLPERAPDCLPVLFLLPKHHARPSFGTHIVLPVR